MSALSVCIITQDEGTNIARCLASVAWADEMLVIDNESTDGTRAKAEAMGARVLIHGFKYFSAQREWARQQAKHRWLLALDADERVSDRLAEEIRQIVAADGPLDGYYIPLAESYLGRPMSFSKGQKRLRLFRKSAGVYPPCLLHEKVEVHGRFGECAGAILHDSCPDLDQCFTKLHRYSYWGGREYLRRGWKPSIARAMARIPLTFLERYVVNGAWRDGVPGLIYSCFASWESAGRELVLWELAAKRQLSQWEEGR